VIHWILHLAYSPDWWGRLRVLATKLGYREASGRAQLVERRGGPGELATDCADVHRFEWEGGWRSGWLGGLNWLSKSFQPRKSWKGTEADGGTEDGGSCPRMARIYTDLKGNAGGCGLGLG
jgi:hypothetical protein